MPKFSPEPRFKPRTSELNLRFRFSSVQVCPLVYRFSSRFSGSSIDLNLVRTCLNWELTKPSSVQNFQLEIGKCTKISVLCPFMANRNFPCTTQISVPLSVPVNNMPVVFVNLCSLWILNTVYMFLMLFSQFTPKSLFFCYSGSKVRTYVEPEPNLLNPAEPGSPGSGSQFTPLPLNSPVQVRSSEGYFSELNWTELWHP